MTPQDLKNSILQLAIQGKLVEQRAEEGTAETLYQQIQEEKQRLVKEGNIKKEKSLPEITEDEIPFDIPDSWKWVRLGDTVSNKSGVSYKKNNLDLVSNNMVRVLRGGNILDLEYIFKSDDVMIDNSFVKNELILRKNMLITPAVTSLEHVGKMARIKCNYDDVAVGGFVLMLIPFMDEDVLSKYLLFTLGSQYHRNMCRKITNKSGQAFYNLSREKLMQLLVPIPPLEEQKRIVAKIEELLPSVDQYGIAYNKLESFNKRFPEDMKKSILQMAIQGKLVEQRAEEGTAEELYRQIQEEKQKLIKEGKIKKEKPLPEITEEEIPFDIPDSWKWVRVGDLFNHNTGKAMNASAKKVDKAGSVRKFITTSNVYWNSLDFTNVKEMYFSDDELERCTVKNGDMLMCEGGAYFGRTAIWNYDYDICFQNHVHRLRQYGVMELMFFYYIFYFYRNMGMMKSKGTAMPGLSSVVLHEMIIPFAPYEEQKRIVSKVEEVLPYCEKLQ